LVCVLQNFFFIAQHSSLLSLPAVRWVLGPAVDLYIFWWADFSAFVAIWIFALALAFLLKKRLPAETSLRKAKLFTGAGALLFFSILLWPVVFLRASGDATQTRQAVSQFQQISASMASHDFKQKEKNFEISSKLS